LSNGQSGLLAGIDKLFSGWITNLTRFLDADNHVSQVKNFALLEAGGTLVLRSEGFSVEALDSLLKRSAFQAELYKSMGMYSTRIIDNFAMPGEKADEFRKALIVPMISGRKISRIYVLEVDQSSAATMSKVALIAASMMTSLLIVLGYSVPAAVAFRRIRERWKAEDQIRFLAMHDPLTGLSNRVQLQNRLEQSLARAKRDDSVLGVMCIDLDRFKEVNDTLGHKAGDAMLREASDRLRGCVRETDTVARIGGDEFVVIADSLDKPTEAIPLARRICEELARTFDIEGHSVAISGSVGISFAPAEGTDVQTLLNNADLALYRAKNDGRNAFRFFEPEMDRIVQLRRSLALDLRHALRNNELHIHYQPQFELSNNMLTGYEALARWTHHEMGEIPPSQFIPIAEENGLIGMLGEWMLETACSYARNWPEGTKLSVNISPMQFAAQDLAAVVRNTLSKTGFPANRLLLEFKEDLLIRNADETVKTLKELTGMGVLLALDDFGTGYSSLSYLTRLPVSKIKIDQSFINQMETDDDIGAIVKTIIGLGKSLDVTIAAEGVETQTQASYLRKAGSNEVQGFLFGRPAAKIQGNQDTMAHIRDQIGDGLPLKGSSEQPGMVNAPVEIESELVELPMLDGDGPASELSRMLPDEPGPRSEPESITDMPETEDSDGAAQRRQPHATLVR
jgi:diguanylate cyclase (GGDEF)-like protein